MQNLLKKTGLAAAALAVIIFTMVQSFGFIQAPKTNAAAVYSDEYGEFLSALGKNESGNSYSARNGSYLGRWQLGTSALIEVGFLTSGGSWTSLAAKYGVTSRETFLKSEAGQDYAVLAYHKVCWKYLVNNGSSKYIGTTYKDITVTFSGLIAAAHLGGPGAVKSMLASGAYVADGNGVTAYSYMKKFGGYDIQGSVTGVSEPVIQQNENMTTEESTEAAEALLGAAVPAYNEEYIENYGDISGDGTINSFDATLVLIYYGDALLTDGGETSSDALKMFVENYKAQNMTNSAETAETGAADDTASDETGISEETSSDMSESGTDAAGEPADTADKETAATVNVASNMESESTSGTEAAADDEESAAEATETAEDASEAETAADEEVTGPSFGDVNADGKIDSKDATSILIYYANMILKNVVGEDTTDVSEEASAAETDTTEDVTAETEPIQKETAAAE